MQQLIREILVRPDRFVMFGNSQGIPFYLVASRDLSALFRLECERHTVGGIITVDDSDSFAQTIATIPVGSHVLVVSTSVFIRSLTPEQVGHRKIAVLAANSTPYSPKDILHFLNAIEATDVMAQSEISQKFFAAINCSDTLSIKSPKFGTSACFDFRDPLNKWFFQGGPLDWGQQQIVPSGEISVLPLAHGSFDENRRLAISGTIALAGYSILHSGKSSFHRTDQKRLYESLRSLEKGVIICDILDGRIEAMRAQSGAESALHTLECMFHIDSRYRNVWEFGIGINRNFSRLSGNFAMNEVYGGTAGLIHLGLGLTPFTQYHLDIVLTETTLSDDSNNILVPGCEELSIQSLGCSGP